jgi:hypothetical protein
MRLSFRVASRFACSIFCVVLASPLASVASEIPDGVPAAVTKKAVPASSTARPSTAPDKKAVTRLNLKNRVDQQPLVFFPVPDAGSEARFTAARPGYSMTLGDSSLTLTSHQAISAPGPAKKPEADPGNGASARPGTVQQKTTSVKVQFLGTDEHAKIAGQEESPAYANFFTGSDPSRWQTHIVGFNRVRYTGLYPGIDLIYYGETHRRLEYDLVVAPGADPQAIRLKVSGDQNPRIAENGDLELDGPDGVIRLDRPILYQTIDHGKKAIAGSFVQLAANEFGFRTSAYDTTRPLVIDPKISLVYATYAGGIHDDQATDLVLDANGAAYVTGFTASQDFPVSGNAVQAVRQNIGTYTYDAFLTKFDASGTLIFSTFLGGNNTDQARAVQLDASGNILLGGYTSSSDFPVTANAYQKTFGGYNDAFLAKLSNDGSQLIYSTYLGGSGSEAINRMRVNTDGSFWAVGDASADGLPVSATAIQQHTLSTADGFVAKLSFDANGNLLIPALTFLGGSNTSGETGLISDLDLDSAGNIYVTGATQSSDFPTTANAFIKSIPVSGGCYNSATPNEAIFITKFSPDLSQMLYSTVLGGKTENQNGYPVCNQYGKTIHVDQTTGNMWVVGSTGMSDFPVTANAISSKLNGNNTAGVDSFVFELSADGQKQLYGTYLGGSQFDYGGAAVWDPSGNIWIAGPTQSTDYPITASTALQAANGGGYDTFVTELSPDGSKILYATYLGGSGDDDISSSNRIRLDSAGNIHMAGMTNSTNYPVTPTAAQPLYANGDQSPDTADAYYAILGTGAIGAIGPIVGGNSGDTTITVSGAGFTSGATCTLVQGTTVLTAVSVTINATGTSMSCTFALNGVTPGSYDVTVTNPNGGGTFTKPGAFSVQGGGSPTIWSDIIGRPIIRTGLPATFNITYGNSGNVDAYQIPASVQLPSTFAVNLAADSNPFSDDNNYYPDTASSKFLQFVIPHLAPGESQTIPVSVTDVTDGDAWTIGVTTGNPAFSNLADAQKGLSTSPTSTACNPAVAGLQNCIALNTAEFVAEVGGILTDMGNADGFTYDPAEANPIFAKYYTTGVNYSINAALNNSRAKEPSFHSNALASRSSANAPVRPQADGVPVPIGPFTVTVGADKSIVNVTFTPTLADAVTFANPVTGAFVGGLVGLIQDIIKDKLQSPNAVCSVYAGGGQAAVYTGKPPTPKCGPCSGGMKQCTDYFQCKGLLSNGQSFTVDIPGTNPYSAPCNPDNPKSCPVKSKSKSRIVESLTALDLPGLPQAASGGSSGCGGGGTGGSVDPNYKSGPAGDGSASQYVTGTAALAYSVGFENEATATLPAAQVVVTDQLDPTKVDLSTLTLGQITFGNNTLTLPSGTKITNTNYKLSSTLSVRVAASLDAASSTLKWTFTTIDPSTGQPPTDPTVGFLPPDTDGIVGQGNVLFNIMPKAGQSTGTVINNSASVVFDANAPIVTPTWTNTLDVDAPASTVSALPARTLVGPFNVAWSGTDKGSGVASYTVYVSDNGAAYTVFQQSVITTSASFTGVAGHTYAFYTISTDGAGNVEPAKTKPDTSTNVVTQLTPLATTTTLATSSTSIAVGTSVNLTATVTPPTGTTQIPTGLVTFMNGTSTLGMISLDNTGKATLATTTLPVGTAAITATYSGDNSFAASASTAVSITVGTPTLSTVSLSPASLTVTNGASATTTVTVGSTFGFSTAATLSCSGLPANSTCSFSPASVTPGTGASASSTMTINTISRTTAAQPLRLFDRGGRIALAFFIPVLLAPLALARRRIRGLALQLTALLLIATTFALITGCGTSPVVSNKGTPAGVSTVTVTATAGTMTQSVTLQLTVN